MRPTLRQKMRDARELALNLLFQVDVAKLGFDEAVEAAAEHAGVAEEAFQCAVDLATGAWANREQMDTLVRELSPDWPTQRQPSVDRNVLRLALYELAFRPEAPSAVVMNEAIELVKIYSTEDSSRFVNGILAAAARRLRKDTSGISGESDHT